MWSAISRLGRHAVPLLMLVLVALALGVWADVRDVQDRIAEQSVVLTQVLGKVGQMTTYTTTWMSGTQTYSVATTCRDGESATACVARHEDAVAALQAIHPPR